jgi:glycosyltransferase involved in cell wall biosynthesis
MIQLLKGFERLIYNNSEAVVALSPGMVAGITNTGYPADKVHFIPNSCDIDFFQAPINMKDIFFNKYPQLQEGPLVVYAGTLGIINGVSYLVEIASAMLNTNPTIRFLIVGDGKEEDKIKKMAIARGVLYKNLWMLPPVSKSEMPMILSASTATTSLFIDIPEMWHNSANKFFDALAAGRPVILNHAGWLADIILESGAGIVLPPNDAAESAKILHDFVCDDKRVFKASQAATKLGKLRFDRDRLAVQFLAVLQKACGMV